MAEQPPDSRPLDSVLDLAADLRRVVGDFVRAVRAGAGTPTTVQMETLGLVERAGPMSVAALAELRNVRHQSMRLVVKQLEAAGLVDRMPDPGDGRSQLVAMNARGRTALSESRAARELWIADAVETRFSDEERRVLRESIALLRRLADAHRT